MMEERTTYNLIEELSKLGPIAEGDEISEERCRLLGELVERMNYLHERMLKIKEKRKSGDDLTEEERAIYYEAKYFAENIKVDKDGKVWLKSC